MTGRPEPDRRVPRVVVDVSRRWARLAVGMGAATYAIYAAFGFLTGRSPGPIQESVVAVVLGFAFAAARRWPAAAAALTVAVTFLEMTFSLFQNGDFYATPALGYPAIVAATGLVFGGTPALLTALACCVVLPAAVFAHRVAFGLHLLTGEEAYFLLSAELVILITVGITAAWSSASNRVLASIEAARRRYHAIFSDAPDGLIELDRSGHIVEANPAAIRLLACDDQPLVGVALTDVLTRAGVKCPVDIAAASPAPPIELELVSLPGRPRVLEITTRAAPVAAEPRSLIAVRDVSERHNARERLDHSQRLEIVGRLAGQVAHDFNNLLTAVGGNASLLAESPEPRVRQLATEIIDAQSRGVALTRQLLAFARRDPRQALALDLEEVVRNASRLLSRVLGERHSLVIEGSAPVPILADRGQIEQLLLNLVVNARDALPDGGPVTVCTAVLSGADAAARGSRLDDERQVLLEIGDHGSGMTAETLAHAFDPFFTTKPRGAGSGLGLAAVNGIVSQSGGHVTIDSKPGVGTTVRVFLPLYAGEVPPLQRAAPTVGPVPPRGDRRRILVVDDDPLVLAITGRVLRTAGYDVVEARDAASAQSAFSSSSSVDLLLTDVAMPGLGGPELAARLRSTSPGLRVLFMSGYVDTGSGSASDKLDPGDLIAKPFRASELLTRIHGCLARQ